MSKLTSVSDEKIKEFCKVVYGCTDCAIERNLEKDSILISFANKDFMKMTKNYIAYNLFKYNGFIYDLYKQWLVAVHRHPLQDNNPFLQEVTMQRIEENIEESSCPDDVFDKTKLINWDALCDNFQFPTKEMCQQCWEKPKELINGK